MNDIALGIYSCVILGFSVVIAAALFLFREHRKSMQQLSDIIDQAIGMLVQVAVIANAPINENMMKKRRKRDKVEKEFDPATDGKSLRPKPNRYMRDQVRAAPREDSGVVHYHEGGSPS